MWARKTISNMTALMSVNFESGYLPKTTGPLYTS